MDGTSEAMSPLLDPHSIAVIGASDSPGNLGARVIGYLRKFNFPGAISPVNPRRDTVAGLKCYPSPSDIPELPELAIFAISAAMSLEAIQSCIDAGIRHGILLAGGFAEIGPEGKALQERLTALCRANNFQLCGPNTVGIINSWMPATSSFSSSLIEIQKLLPGNISMVSQSGGTAITAQLMAQREGFGFRYVISVGDEAVLNVSDFMRMVAADAETKVIPMYLEGARDGAAFIDALEKNADAGKIFVILKSGTAEVSARAAAAHTGSLAGEDRVWRAVFREYGVVPVTGLRELVDMSLFISGLDQAKLPKGDGVAVIGLGQGTAEISADLCVRNGLAAPALSAATQAALQKLAPAGARIGNPLVLTDGIYAPGALARFGQVLDAVGADPAIHAILFDDAYGPLPGEAASVAIAEALAAFSRRSDKTLLVSWAPDSAAARAILVAAGLYAFPEPVRAIDALSRLVGSRVAFRTRRPPRPAALDFDWARFVPEPRAGLVISEHECHRILAAAGLPVARGQLAVTADDAVRAARDVEFPVAIKGISPTVTHRAAAGLLALDVRGDDNVRRVHAELSAKAAANNVQLDGLYVQHMERGEIEVIVSAIRDPVFGVMVTVGAGGTVTEAIDDVTLERAPFDEPTARAVLERLRIVSLARRLDPDADLGALARFVAHFSRLAAAAPWSRFALEVNPVKWRGDVAVAVDGLLIIEEV